MHYLRPLYLVLAITALILIARLFLVPPDFGIHARGYMYGWYRAGDVADWKAFPVRYQGRDFCRDCHTTEMQDVLSSPHRIIECENCHGPAIGHPENPGKLTIDRSRELCLRCHALLPYADTLRAGIRGIDPGQHNTGMECALCHPPHLATKPG